MPQYRQVRNYENLTKAIFTKAKAAGPFDIPQLQPVYCDLEDWISFNYAKTCKEPYLYGLHFFVDDYQFQRLWSSPDKYVSLLSRFGAVMTPDFSLYTDYPKVVQLYNHYRKHWLGAYWQYRGITVIPTIGWSDENSLNWCFDGEPVGGTVAVSSVGTQTNSAAKALFQMGYNAMLDRLKPESILFYGAIPEECKADNVIHLAAYQEKLKKIDENAGDTGKEGV